MSVINRSTPDVGSDIPESNNQGANVDLPSSEPIELREERSGDVLLESLGIQEDVKALPEKDKENLKEAKNYIYDLMKVDGLKNTVGSFKKTLDKVMGQMDLSSDTEISIVLDKIGGLVKAYKSISFIADPKERRALFMKMARQTDSKAMDKIALEAMEARMIWR